MTEYPNWFQGIAQENFEKFLTPLAGKPTLTFVQVGVFTGDASVWLKENVLTADDALLLDVDTWKGSDEGAHHAMDFEDVFSTYKQKIKSYDRIILYRMPSDMFFHALQPKEGYDFVYIDGDHTAEQTYRDGCNAWNNLKQGGIIAFDDYLWGAGLPDQTLAPQPGIDKFLEERKDQYELLEHGAQVWIRKN